VSEIASQKYLVTQWQATATRCWGFETQFTFLLTFQKAAYADWVFRLGIPRIRLTKAMN
jgi:hypothetical protein